MLKACLYSFSSRLSSSFSTFPFKLDYFWGLVSFYRSSMVLQQQQQQPLSTSTIRKSPPTCTVSLAHAEVVSGVNCALVHKPRPALNSNEISVIPFPTLPKTHALLRMTHSAPKRSRKPSSSPKPKIVAAPMHRRRSRDPNVADRLVVELDDDDLRHTRPCSPTPEPQVQLSRATSPDHLPPPAYSTLPPPYSVSTDDKKDAPIVVHKPSIATPPPPSASSSSSCKRSRVSTSELRVLLYLYRTVVYGLEMRNRKEKESTTPDLKQPLNPPRHKPLGPRASRPASLIPPPEDKFHFESALAVASAKPQGGFAIFPLVEDDLDTVKDSKDREYVTPRTPFHSPSQSPRSSPLPFLRRPSPSLDAVASHFAKPKKEKTKVEINAELHVQDALLALRLKEFLRAQGVCEDDLKVDIDEEGKMVEPDKEKVVNEEVQPQEAEESNVLDEYFMGIEEQENNGTPRGPVVEDDDVVVKRKLDSPLIEEDDLDMDMSSSSSPPPLPSLQLPTTMSQRISSPPPPSPSPRPHAVLPTSYMVALLTMRNRHPSKKPGSSSSSSSGSTIEKGKTKRKSGLSVVVEVD